VVAVGGCGGTVGETVDVGLGVGVSDRSAITVARFSTVGTRVAVGVRLIVAVGVRVSCVAVGIPAVSWATTVRRFAVLVGVTVGVLVGVFVGVAVDVAVGVVVGVLVSVDVMVGVWVALGVLVGVAVGVIVLVAVGVGVGAGQPKTWKNKSFVDTAFQLPL
jgi:hypothetical protein